MSSRKAHGSRQKHGYCALTKRPGKLVKSHIIPEALTKPSVAGSPLVQHGLGCMPSQRWSSWYDDNLVTAEGESVLAELDNWGIRELRRLRLVWSGWEHREQLEINEELHVPWQWLGIRRIVSADVRLLRRFLQSLLWRAAATRRPEFAEVSLDANVSEQLRLVVLGDRPDDEFLPVYLVQHSTKGPMHNRTPYADVLEQEIEIEGTPTPIHMPTLRFYFDGLVVHFVTAIPQFAPVQDLKRAFVGCNDAFYVATISYEESAERKGFDMLMNDYNRIQQTSRGGK